MTDKVVELLSNIYFKQIKLGIKLDLVSFVLPLLFLSCNMIYKSMAIWHNNKLIKELKNTINLEAKVNFGPNKIRSKGKEKSIRRHWLGRKVGVK
jgi:cell division protein FtsL